MLILPMERTFDIRRPPIVTILLLIINVIVFMSTRARSLPCGASYQIPNSTCMRLTSLVVVH